MLQAIHTHKPTVFKSGGPQYQQRGKDLCLLPLRDLFLNVFFFFGLVVRSAQPHLNQVQPHTYQSNTIQQNSFYGSDINQQTPIWNPQCPSQASTSSFHQQSPVIVQQQMLPGSARLNQQQQPIVPQQTSSMPMPMVDVNNVIVKQEYPSAIPPMQSNAMQQFPSALPHQLMQTAVVQSEIQTQNSVQSNDNPQNSVQAAFHSNNNPSPINQFPVQQQSAVLNVQNVMNPSNTTIQSNTVFHQQQQLMQQFSQQRIVVQPNSVPANNQSNT